MAVDVVSFIKEQLAAGRDVRTIRGYLISRNISPAEVDKAFDKTFGRTRKVDKSRAKSPIEKFVIGGIFVLVFLMVIAGISIYKNISPGIIDNEPIVDTGLPDTTIPDSTQNLGETNSVCEEKEADEKYDCYVSLIERDSISCYELEDDEERDYCYRVHDYYILEQEAV